ncbi:MAG: SRPBCC family protein [Pseudorhodoplanes sp.]|nr:SRPBCC family protein [Pseudorhodoplanes sp.]
MLRKILIGLGALVILLAVFAAVVALQPSEYRVERSTMIAAPVETVFAQVNDFHKWEAWSPWAKRDPNAKTSFHGAASGQGAKLSWSGNDQVGAGTMTLIESIPARLIKIDVAFTRPFEGSTISEFAFRPQGSATAVTWASYGEQNFIGKAICLFVSMDRVLGGDLEQGLAQLKAVAETAPK